MVFSNLFKGCLCLNASSNKIWVWLGLAIWFNKGGQKWKILLLLPNQDNPINAGNRLRTDLQFGLWYVWEHAY